MPATSSPAPNTRGPRQLEFMVIDARCLSCGNAMGQDSQSVGRGAQGFLPRGRGPPAPAVGRTPRPLLRWGELLRQRRRKRPPLRPNSAGKSGRAGGAGGRRGRRRPRRLGSGAAPPGAAPGGGQLGSPPDAGAPPRFLGAGAGGASSPPGGVGGPVQDGGDASSPLG